MSTSRLFKDVNPEDFDEETRELYKVKEIADSEQRALVNNRFRQYARQYRPAVTTLPDSETDPNINMKYMIAGLCFWNFATWNFAKGYFPYGDLLRASQNQSYLKQAWYRAPLGIAGLGFWYLFKELPRQ